MGSLGLPEMIVIGIIALLVFGPKKLPELGKSLGKGIREFQKATEQLKSGLDEHMHEANKTILDVKQNVTDVKNTFDPKFHIREQLKSLSEPIKPKAVTTEDHHSEKEVHQI